MTEAAARSRGSWADHYERARVDVNGWSLHRAQGFIIKHGWALIEVTGDFFDFAAYLLAKERAG